MPTLPNMTLILPTLGGSSGTWDDLLNAALTLVDSHDHTSGKGVQVPTTGININANLSFGGYAATALGQTAFTAVAALASGSKTLFVSSSDNELYWRTNGGTNVKLTSGTSLNITAFAGGIVGDYTAVSAEVAYDDANDRYTFKQPTNWARLASGEVRIYETGTSESLYVGLAAPSALAGSYTITLPLAAPASTAIMQMSSAGVVTCSNTVANAVTFSAALTASTSVTTPTMGGTPNFTGAVTMASTLGVTSLVTATAGLTAGANAHVTVSGTGKYKHGTYTRTQPLEYTYANAASYVGNLASNVFSMTLAASGILYIPLRNLELGDRVLTVTVRATATVEPTIAFTTQSAAAGPPPATGSSVATTSSGGPITANNLVTHTLDTPITIDSNGQYIYMYLTAAGGSAVVLYSIEYTYDRP